ncbi:MAG TPA: aroma-sacti cluster domain-containing protein [Holophagaceae bacterium]|nr:aroma-sacti cluster domain-containing protein [Holophagaceae bacterium]
MSHHSNHQILAQAGLLPEGACAETRARIASLSPEEVQHLVGTRARLEQAHGQREHGFLIM